MDDDAYKNIMELLKGRDIKIVVDATKELLVKSLPYGPFLIKPNNYELGEIFGVRLTTRSSVIPYAKKLQNMGARNALSFQAVKRCRLSVWQNISLLSTILL